MNWEKRPGYAASVCSNIYPTQYGKVTGKAKLIFYKSLGGPCSSAKLEMTGKLNNEGVVSVTIKSGDSVTSSVEIVKTVDYATSVEIGFEVF